MVQTGTYISGLGHITVIGWVILGGEFYSNPPPPKPQVANVSIISAAAFSAAMSNAPALKTRIDQLAAPKNAQRPPNAPKPQIRPKQVAKAAPFAPQQPAAKPDLSSVRREPQASVLVDAPTPGLQPTTDMIGTTLVLPTAPIDRVDRNGITPPDRLAIVTPAQPFAPKIDTTPAPKPPTDAKKSPIVEKASTPVPGAKSALKPKSAKAPAQAATEIVTEAKKKKKTAAPIRSSRPRGRPAKLAAKTKAPKPSAIEKAIAQDLANKTAPRTARLKPPPPASGPPLTAGEKDALRLAVRECWNVNPSSDAARITVTVAVSMDKSGKPVASSIRLLSATAGVDTAKRSAFDAARRAILRCAKSGYKLPAKKYGQWRDIEMTFNPDKMRIK